MKQITNKQYAEYMQFLEDKRNGRILQPLTLRSICQSYNVRVGRKGPHPSRAERANFGQIKKANISRLKRPQVVMLDSSRISKMEQNTRLFCLDRIIG